jgi:hypothetical protein
MKIISRILFVLVLLICAVYVQFSEQFEQYLRIKANTAFIIALIIFGIFSIFGINKIEDSVNGIEKRLRDFINRISSWNKASINSTSFESSFGHLAHILSTSSNILEVYNTIIGPAVIREIPHYKEYIEQKIQVIRKGAKWYDLISLGDIGRLLGIVKTIRKLKGDYYLAMVNIEGLKTGTFLNFMLIRGIDSLGNEYKEIAIGWESTPFSPDQQDEIIIIRNETLYSRYKRHFQFLWDRFSEVETFQEIRDGEIIKGKMVGRLLRTELEKIFNGKDFNKYKTSKSCSVCNEGELFKFPGFTTDITICSNYGNGCAYIK